MGDSAKDLKDMIKYYQEVIERYEPLVSEAHANLAVIQKAAELIQKESNNVLENKFRGSIFPDASTRYSDMSMPKVIISILRNSSSSLTTVEIVEEAVAGGFTCNSKNMRGDFSVTINRLKKKGLIQPRRAVRGMVYKLYER